MQSSTVISKDVQSCEAHYHWNIKRLTTTQGWTDNSWGPRAIGNHGASVSLPKLKKAYEKGTRGISWGPLLTPSPRAVPEFPNGQFAPAT
ncbi:unnamed protein product, partial [Staurois parvus]